MRTFVITRERDVGLGLPQGKVAEGVQFDDGHTIVRILKGPRADRPPFLFPSLREAIEVLFHFGDSRLDFN